MKNDFKKLVLGSAGKKRVKSGAWSIPNIKYGEVALCRRCKKKRIKHTSKNYGICPKCHKNIDYIMTPQNESERSLYR